MNVAFLSAFAALTGSAVGGLTSFLSSWTGQKGQIKAGLVLHEKGCRHELYREFIEQASVTYIDALTCDVPDLSKLIRLYALVNRMRVISSLAVIEQAESVARMIVHIYGEPNKTLNDLRLMVNEKSLDPLSDFSDCCRRDLHETMVW